MGSIKNRYISHSVLSLEVSSISGNTAEQSIKDILKFKITPLQKYSGQICFRRMSAIPFATTGLW